MNYTIMGFNKIFDEISKRVDHNIVFKSFIDYSMQKIMNESINLSYDYDAGEFNLFEELFWYWLNLTKQEINKTGVYDFFGIYYESYVLTKNKASSKGQFFTPQSVCDCLSDITPSNDNACFYDPACGSGRMALSYSKNNPGGRVFLEDLDEFSVKMSILNLFAHEIPGVVQWCDSLSRKVYMTWEVSGEDINVIDSVKFKEDMYDVCLANPPYSVKWDADKSLLKHDPRFNSYTKLAPRTKADYAFIQHILHGLKEDGVACIIMPQGVLFRGNSEGEIRKKILDDNLLDAVIGLPPQIFVGSGIPTVLLIFKKNRANDSIFFIDAKDDYIKSQHSKLNVLTDEHVKKILSTYTSRRDVDKYSFNATLDFIQENNYNLNIPRYVDTFEEEKEVDLKKLIQDLEWNNREQMKINNVLNGYFCELSVPWVYESNMNTLESNKQLLNDAHDMVQSTLDAYYVPEGGL